MKKIILIITLIFGISTSLFACRCEIVDIHINKMNVDLVKKNGEIKYISLDEISTMTTRKYTVYYYTASSNNGSASFSLSEENFNKLLRARRNFKNFSFGLIDTLKVYD